MKIQNNLSKEQLSLLIYEIYDHIASYSSLEEILLLKEEDPNSLLIVLLKILQNRELLKEKIYGYEKMESNK